MLEGRVPDLDAGSAHDVDEQNTLYKMRVGKCYPLIPYV